MPLSVNYSIMKLSFQEIEAAASTLSGIGKLAASSCAWLQACDYPGVSLLLEALADEQKDCSLERDAMGLDLKGVSCVFLGEAILNMVRSHGRLFLRNVRHGLYLVPLSVDASLSIGCPIDPAFALGGPREKNPYVEKLALAEQNGIVVEDALWQALQQAGEKQ